MVMNDFFEKTLEDLIYDKRKFMKEKGLDIFYENTIRQFQIDSKRFDMLTWEVVDEVLFCRIIELKREKLNFNNVFQLLEYHSILIGSMAGYFKKIKIELVLIGTDASYNVPCITHISNIFRIFKYSYGFDGIKFTEIGKNNDSVNKMVSDFNKDEDFFDIYEVLIS